MAEESEASVLTCKKSRVVFLGALRVTTVTSICIILTLRPSLGPSPKAGSTTPQPRALHAAAADRLPHFQTDVSASNSERADASRGFGWPTHLSPRKPSVADPGRSNDSITMPAPSTRVNFGYSTTKGSGERSRT